MITTYDKRYRIIKTIIQTNVLLEHCFALLKLHIYKAGTIKNNNWLTNLWAY